MGSKKGKGRRGRRGRGVSVEASATSMTVTSGKYTGEVAVGDRIRGYGAGTIRYATVEALDPGRKRVRVRYNIRVVGRPVSITRWAPVRVGPRGVYFVIERTVVG